MDYSKFAIFYHTCDKYSDLWEHFFFFLKKYWPEFVTGGGKIYLNSENKSFEYPGLNIINLRVGTCDFSEREIRGLNCVKEDYILLMMDDLFLMGQVDALALEEYFDYFMEANLDTLIFRKLSTFVETIPVHMRQAQVVIPPSIDMYSSQLAFWKTSVFKSLLNPHDGPWEMEWFGSMRANFSHLRMVCTDEPVIPSLPGGALRIGRWDPQYISFLEKENYHKIDYSVRGILGEAPTSNTIKKRLKFQWRNFFSPSRLDIIRLMWRNRKYYWNR